MRSLLALPFLVLATTGQCQLAGRTSIGGGIGLAIPTGQFQDTWGRNLFNINGHLGVPMGLLPFQTGFAFDYSQMGSHDQVVPIAISGVDATEADLRVKAKVLSYHPLLRFNPLRGKVRPYVDGMVGMRHFTTKSRVTVDGLEEPVRRERNSSDLVFSSGWAVGLMYGLGSMGYIEARVARFNSGKTTYVDPGSIVVNDQGNIAFNTLSSNTDVVHVTLGIGLSF
ncbi:MAG TPA: hypothetical protein VGE21_06710 [Flavobacteriales bacterium]